MHCTIIDIRGDYAFVKYDDTKDNKDNPTWKLVAMKEIVNNAD